MTVKRDTVPPAISLTTPPDGATYSLDQVVAADYSCADAGSGVMDCAGPVPDGANIQTSTTGAKSFAVTSTDAAGLSSTLAHDYTVEDVIPSFTFIGFFPPVKNLPKINGAEAGRTIPVKWRLKDANGNLVTDLASFVSFESASVACHELPIRAASAQWSSGEEPPLKYDPKENLFLYEWKTARRWRGCRQIQLTPSDGSVHFAKFRFR